MCRGFESLLRYQHSRLRVAANIPEYTGLKCMRGHLRERLMVRRFRTTVLLPSKTKAGQALVVKTGIFIRE